MLCDSWPTANLHGTLGERVVRCLAAPHVRLTWPERRQPRGGQTLERRVRLLNVLEPARRVELVKDDLAGKFDERSGTEGGSCEATRMLVPLWRISRTTSTRPRDEIGAVDVLVGLVEDNQLVERTARRSVASANICSSTTKRPRASSFSTSSSRRSTITSRPGRSTSVRSCVSLMYSSAKRRRSSASSFRWSERPECSMPSRSPASVSSSRSFFMMRPTCRMYMLWLPTAPMRNFQCAAFSSDAI